MISPKRGEIWLVRQGLKSLSQSLSRLKQTNSRVFSPFMEDK